MFEPIFLILIIPISLLFEGIRRKLTARFQNRIGPPIWQPFYDVAKLWKKGKSDSKASDNVFFRFTPFLYLVSSFVLFLFIPFQFISFGFDFILLIYITILCSGFYVLAGFASNSPFGIVGSMREIITMVVYESSLAVIVFSFMINANTVTLAGYPVGLFFLSLPISTVCLFLVNSIEMKITPLDTAEAETEIMHGYKTEFSSRGLAMLELSKYLKFTFFIFIFTFFLFGPVNWIAFAVLSLVFLFIFTIAQATTSRFRVDQTFKLFVPILILALADIVRLVVL